MRTGGHPGSCADGLTDRAASCVIDGSDAGICSCSALRSPFRMCYSNTDTYLLSSGACGAAGGRAVLILSRALRRARDGSLFYSAEKAAVNAVIDGIEGTHFYVLSNDDLYQLVCEVDVPALKVTQHIPRPPSVRHVEASLRSQPGGH